MITETVDLYAYFGLTRKEGEEGFLSVYCRERTGDLGKKLRPGVLVVPGGAYCFRSAREEEPVALRFLAEGYSAFVLRYTVNAPYPAPLREGAMAVAYLRENAEKYDLSGQIAVAGFSAGGHLAAMLATMFREEETGKALGERAKLARPDAVVLAYPVVTMGEFAHAPSAAVVTGGKRELYDSLSLEKRVTKESVPVFLWHTAEDDLVPVENSLLLAAAYRRAGVPFELHVFEKGPHGLSVASAETETKDEGVEAGRHAAVWFRLALGWLERRGFRVRCV